MAEILPSDPPSPASAPATGCCEGGASQQPDSQQGSSGPNPSSQPSGADNADNNLDSSDASAQSNTDPPTLKKARISTRTEIERYQAAPMASRNFGNDFSDRPAWAYAMGDTGATAAMGQLATAPNSGVQNQAYSLPATLPEQLDPVNQAVVAELEKEMRTGCQSKELCFDSVLRLYQWAGATPKFRVQALNTKIDLYNEKIKELKNRNPHMSPRPLKDELTDGEKDLFDKKLRYGLFAGDDNFLRLLVERLQSGDIVHFPGYTLLIKKKHQPPQPVDFAGHVGILLFNPKKNQWEVVSTHNEKNGKVIPGWQVEPLEDFSFRYFCRSNQLPEFYHWIGPDPLPRR